MPNPTVTGPTASGMDAYIFSGTQRILFTMPTCLTKMRAYALRFTLTPKSGSNVGISELRVIEDGFVPVIDDEFVDDFSSGTLDSRSSFPQSAPHGAPQRPGPFPRVVEKRSFSTRAQFL
jgi:hypothetical protein